MIYSINSIDKRERSSILEAFQKFFDYDSYYIENNSKIFVSDVKTLKRFRSRCHKMFGLKEAGDYKGIISLWINNFSGKKRFYVKLNADNLKTADKLITSLCWNFNRDMYVKIRKNNKFIRVFRSKGFKFKGGRGLEILLHRKPTKDFRIEEKNNV